MDHLYSTGQLARLLGLKSYQIEYALSTNQLPEPSSRFLGKRVYGPEDVKRVAQHFGIMLNGDLVAKKTGEENQ